MELLVGIPGENFFGYISRNKKTPEADCQKTSGVLFLFSRRSYSLARASVLV